MDTTNFDTLITHPDRDVRLRAAMDAGTLHDPQVTAALVVRLGTEDDFHVLESITWAIAQHGEAAVPAVLGLLTSASPSERRQAAHVLSKIGDPAHIPHLVAVVADEDPDVAVKAYRAAANTGGSDAVHPLVARLGDGDTGQRDALSDAMQTLGDLGVDALIVALQDRDQAVRLHAVEALSQIGEEADVAASALAGLTADADPEVSLAAVMALGAVGGDDALAALEDVAASGNQPLDAVARRLLSDAPPRFEPAQWVHGSGSCRIPREPRR